MIRLLVLNCLLLIWLVGTGCQRDMSSVENDKTNGYVSKKIELKKSAENYEMYMSELLELNKEFSILGVNKKTDNMPIVPKMEGIGGKTPKVFANGLMKKQSTNHVIAIKSVLTPIEAPYRESFSVNTNRTITVECTNAGSGVDPFLVLYEVMNPGENSQELQVLAFNDDYSGLKPKVSYTNSSGAYKTIYALMFSYDTLSKGNADLTISITYHGSMYRTATAQCFALFSNQSAIDEGGNNVNISEYTPIEGGTYGYATNSRYCDGMFGTTNPYSSGDSYIWVFNFATMKGVANDDDVGVLSSVVCTEPSWTSFSKSPWHYPNVVLVGGYSTGGITQFIQAGIYSKD